MSYDYTEFRSSLLTELVIKDANGITNFDAILPRIIEYAELRMYREFDFLATRTRDYSQTATAGLRQVVIPPTLVVIEEVSVITPDTVSDPNAAGAQRIPLLRTSRQYIDLTWPEANAVQAPVPFETYYAVYSEQEQSGEGAQIPNAIIIAPTLDANYHVEFAGTFRPDPLSSANPNTILTALFPDAFFALGMVHASGYLRDYGRASDDPQMAMSWEAIYQGLKPGIGIEEARKFSASIGATTAQPRPANSPPMPAMPGR